MGNDHDSRKLAKKKNRKSGRASQLEFGGKRIRLKAAHKRKRKNCRGMCYDDVPPVVNSIQEVVEEEAEVDDDGGFLGGQVMADEPEPVPVDEQKQPDKFIYAKFWRGAKPGYIFTMGGRGLGYYLDAKELKKLQKKRSNEVSEKKSDTLKEKKTKVSSELAGEEKSAKGAKKTSENKTKNPSVEAKKDKDPPESFLNYLATFKHENPTPIQKRCWEGSMDGRDVLVVAPPGAGKTLAYLLPAGLHVSNTTSSAPPLLQVEGKSKKGKKEREAVFAARPTGLVLVPTRELAQQVFASCRHMKRIFKITPAAVYGGTKLQEQADALENLKPQLIIGTPGRTLDFIQKGHLLLDQVSIMVLDEADKMLSLGFQEQLQDIVAHVPEENNRQTLFLSATFPKKVSQVAADWLNDPLCIRSKDSGPSGGKAVANEGAGEEEVKVEEGGGQSGKEEALAVSTAIKQVVHVCADHKKPKKLIKFLTSTEKAAQSAGMRNPPRTLVFANQIKTVKFIGDALKRLGQKYSIFHGGQSQEVREKVLKDFKAAKTRVLVATDVAGRGLHINGLEQVVNWDFPGNLEQYIHRVGRTGRNGCGGHSFTFFTRKFAPVAPALLHHLKQHNQEIDPNLVTLAEIAEKAGVASEAVHTEEDPEEEDQDGQSDLPIEEEELKDVGTEKKRKKNKGAVDSTSPGIESSGKKTQVGQKSKMRSASAGESPPQGQRKRPKTGSS